MNSARTRRRGVADAETDRTPAAPRPPAVVRGGGTRRARGGGAGTGAPERRPGWRAPARDDGRAPAGSAAGRGRVPGRAGRRAGRSRCGSRGRAGSRAGVRRRGLLSLTCPMGVWGRPACLGTASRVHLVVDGSVVPAAPGVWSVVLGAAAPSCAPRHRAAGAAGAEGLGEDGVCETTVKPSPLVAFFATPRTLPSERRRKAAIRRGDHAHRARPAWPGAGGDSSADSCWVSASWVSASSPEVACRSCRANDPAAHRDVEQQQAHQAGGQQHDARDREGGAARARPGAARARHDPQAGGGRGDGVRWSWAIRDGAVIWLMGAVPSWLSVRSAARSRAEAARGLAACSAALGSSAPRVSSRRYGACSGSSTGRPCGVRARGARRRTAAWSCRSSSEW